MAGAIPRQVRATHSRPRQAAHDRARRPKMMKLRHLLAGSVVELLFLGAGPVREGPILAWGASSGRGIDTASRRELLPDADGVERGLSI